jgi:shikimate dehydrogenase
VSACNWVCVLGDPVGHSRSPAMQNAAFRALGLDWFYCAIEVSSERFDARVGQLRGQGFVGANVTVPHKVAALALADEVDATARAVGAANTLKLTSRGVKAWNTDVVGVTRALETAGLSSLTGLPTLLLGAGGSARAAAYALAAAGANPLWIWNRTPERATRLARDLRLVTDATGVQAVAAVGALAGAAKVVVNATTIGMGRSNVQNGPPSLKDYPLGDDALHEGQVVLDLAYRPGGTELINSALLHGAAAVDGFEVLVQQGAESFKIWTGLDPPLEAMRSSVSARVRGGQSRRTGS